MGQFRDVGKPAAALMEECGEVIQIIAKFYRFPNSGWDEVPPGSLLSRWHLLESEMEDLIYQWNRLRKEKFPDAQVETIPTTPPIKHKIMARNMIKDFKGDTYAEDFAAREADNMFNEDIINEMEDDYDEDF